MKKLLRNTVGYVADRIPRKYPDGHVTLNAATLAHEHKQGRRFRLLEVHGAPVPRFHGQPPLITGASYEADGEDGRPTVYMSAEDKPGEWPLDPADAVVVIADRPAGGVQ